VSSDVTKIAAGADHVCVANSAGSALCIGATDDDQVGGSAFQSACSAGHCDQLLAISAGAHHTCVAIDGTGAIYCWGNNVYGVVGSNTVACSTTPVAVAAP